MADNKKKISKQIAQMTEAIKENIEDPELAGTVSKDFEELLTSLNCEVEDRIEQYRSASIRIMRDTYQTRPFKIFDVIDELVEKIYATTLPLASCMNPVMDNCLRRETADCLKDLIDIYQRAIAQKYLKSRFHAGDKPN